MDNLNLKLFLLFILFRAAAANCQDYIIYYTSGIYTIRCTDIEIKDGKVIYSNLEDGIESELSLDDIYSINFYDEKPDEIYLPSFQFDTIKCIIDSISGRKIFYRQENNLLQAIDIESVFCIRSGECGYVPEINAYRSAFVQMHRTRLTNASRIVKRDGSQMEITRLISLNGDKMEIQMILNGIEIKTYAPLKDLISFVNKEPPVERKTNSFNKEYFLSRDGNFIEVQIEGTEKDAYDCSINMGNKTIHFNQMKNSFDGVFFYNFKEHAVLQKNTGTYVSGENSRQLIVRPGLHAGIGYSLAKVPEDYTDEQKKYVKKMRLGFAFDANFDIFLNEHIAIGAKYNQYSTSNSILDVAEDNIAVRFIGGKLSNKIPLKNNTGFFCSSFSIGYLSEVNNAKLLDEEIKIAGSTVGVYFSAGYDFLLGESIAIGIQGGFLGGLIFKYKIDQKVTELDKPESLSRVDGMIGLKFYFQ
jgi:hypothetical protein